MITLMEPSGFRWVKFGGKRFLFMSYNKNIKHNGNIVIMLVTKFIKTLAYIKCYHFPLKQLMLQ